MSVVTVPQKPGAWTPEEALAWQKAMISTSNLAGDEVKAGTCLKLVTSIVSDYTERMGSLFRQWRGTWHMLKGNTLSSGGPEDVHSPELYKQMETIIPRAEEQMLDHEPFFRVVPRRKTDRDSAIATESYMDWLLTQAKLRSLIQPALRDMLVAQAAVFYVHWDNHEAVRDVRTRISEIGKDGVLKRSVKIERKKVVDYSGVRIKLVDPVDWLVDTKATDPQTALFCGHRAWLTIEQIREMAPQMGWQNVSELKEGESSKTLGPYQNQYSWGRDPTARVQSGNQDWQKKDERASKIEVVFLHTRATFDEGKTYVDYRMVVAGGTTVLELRENPEDFRPYATMRVTKSGHEFYGIGPFDNTIRLNQHLDRLLQIVARGSALSAQSIAFADEDGDLPDNLYSVTPGKIFKGVGNIRFTQVPDGFLRATPMLISMWQRNIEETSGSFRIQMGQDSGGGTATEATLALQEGNRRMRGIVRSMGDGLEQLLDIVFKYMCKYSVEDVEFPVLGKRAIDLRKTHMTVGPADFLEDVHFELVGLRNARNYGLKGPGMKAFADSMSPFMMANPQATDQVKFMHDFASEMIGPEEADAYIKVPTPLDRLKSQREENEGLIQGAEIEIDPDDDDAEHLREIQPLWQEAVRPDSRLPEEVRRVVIQHVLQHTHQMDTKQAQEQARQRRMPTQQQLPPEAGGQPSADSGRRSPQAGGLSDSMTQLLYSPGQQQGENPGPAESGKFRRGGRGGRASNQSNNTAMMAG